MASRQLSRRGQDPRQSHGPRLGITLDQRIATRYAIKPMDLAESAAYLRHHMTLAGREKPLFADDATARLHRVWSMRAVTIAR
jgi:hypothetical protein